MPFTKGHKLSTGRPKGSNNILTTQIKEKITSIIENELKHTQKMFTKMREENPAQAIRLLIDLTEYVISKKGRDIVEEDINKPKINFNFNVNADKIPKEELLKFFSKRGNDIYNT